MDIKTLTGLSWLGK